MSNRQPVHPRGLRARVLLSSVFGPYAQDDAYGSRRLNPMELYQNQVTRLQGGFSLRMFHRSFGLMMIQENLDVPCTLLDFPTLDGFKEEIARQPYDVIGIGAIVANIDKVRVMCSLIRRIQPEAKIIIGGHIANKEGLSDLIDADHIVLGEGIRWFQRYLGQDDRTPIRHPSALSGFGARMMGIRLGDRPGGTAAILIPSVGCPMGCNFCSTSALFGGKGHFINFFETGDELFEVMCRIERELKVRSFFTLDENFLLQRKRALRLLELMEKHDKSWALYVFSSAQVLQSYSIDELARLGIGWVWMGLEGEKSVYNKLDGVDTKALVDRLQDHGIRVLGSSIIGLEDHRPETLDAVIDYAVGHGTVFHQFMLYMPIPGTPLYEEYKEKGSLMAEEAFPHADAHGQFRFNYRHRHIPAGQEEGYLLEAFRRDFAVNGPSLLRLIQVTLNGWQMYKKDPRERIRKRVRWESLPLRSSYAGAVWAMGKWYRGNATMTAKVETLLAEIYKTFGWTTRLVAPLIGRFALAALRREQARLDAGWSYEPRSTRVPNQAARALEKTVSRPILRGKGTLPLVLGDPAATLGKPF